MNKKVLFSFVIMAAVIAAIFFWLRPVENVTIQEDEQGQDWTQDPTVMKPQVLPTATPTITQEIKQDDTETSEKKMSLAQYCQSEPMAFVKQRLDNLMQEFGDQIQDQLETYNLEFVKDSMPFRIQMSMDEDTQGRSIQQINFFSLDREGLPVREDLPIQFQDRPWEDVLDQIKRQYQINWQEEQHLMITPNGEIIRAIIRDGKITSYEDKQVICRDEQCSCENL
ncbi:MAG: hypothetical protein COW00_19080 [Bdellovibrio sp. CG12_big_fil_rev_8_21_14_0_65_39_13]|nr:MAG: hypothetical protein COW78_17195 [Bdellovibrio sp. CG22_combo_CG10-13_8_21_14_all_39_27]PIQ57801.1 MAG: hypothetical protein COW00_19080 [Bdellovibrio sp. CG12_big_fil_rev_8_21_14_0_65_39_13]PIR34675.1 MAG: hypothetical protein COV37_12130 [Bdellovibrio sp. CG11_big_fil_rev_8_21_14_0_20_39_38]